ncbi:MAG: hypothetical protein J5757_04240 [Lachnospiraceae bacterium]|nr:hypothetical protein [Lachnospiraceae bacterium]
MGLFGKKGKGTELMITASPMSHKGGILDTTQSLIALKNKEKPFDSKLTVRFEVDNFEGKDAIEIYLNDELIGEVPGFMVEKITPLLEKNKEVSEVKVFGGEDDRPYGCTLRIRFS